MNNEKVRPDYSIRININDSDESYLLDPRFDFVRVFPWLEYGVVNVITDEGVRRIYTSQEQCETINRDGGIPLVELEWISESEHETFIGIMANDLESWIE